MKTIIIVVVICLRLCSVPAAMAAEPQNAKSNSDAATVERGSSNDAWRYKFYQGHWWYWLPANRWAVYEKGRWLLPPERAPTDETQATDVKTAAADKQGGSFAEDYPAVPVGSEPKKQSADYYLSVGNVFSKHAHEHAQVLERYAAAGETVPANIVREQAKAIHHDVEQAQKSFSQVAVADEEITSENLPDAVKKLHVGLGKVAASVTRLESQVQRQGTIEATLVRAQTAIINRLLQQASQAARAAEEEQRKYEQNQKDLAGVD